jgi:hypothetical protein
MLSILGWPDSVLIPVYYKGLKDYLKDALVYVKRAKILRDFIDQV